ncbi:uncharacterized protein LOC114291700 [Camellia sinensis]|uniref:uncharacterized protein LOC114291700 n=1 Tax=Camellia sinensis TaxID=4442 RepID=UPI001036DEC6|nr:uncharacterized protein LOC114291700 [Camellia sinensis]
MYFAELISMVQKRPFVDEETYEVSCKYQRQLEYSNQLVSFLEFVLLRIQHSNQTFQENSIRMECYMLPFLRLEIINGNLGALNEGLYSSVWLTGQCVIGEGGGCFIKGDEKHTELLICTENDGKTSSPDSVSNTSLDSCSVSKEDNGSEVPFHLLFSHDRCNPDWPRRTLVHSEEIYTSLLECPPRKLVPVGSDFQADIPEWGTQGTKNVTGGSNGSEPLTHFPQASELDLSDHNDDETKLAGICVIPMPEFGPSAYNGDTVGDGRTDCCCRDSGSDRCVRQHIKEAREKLWRILGPESFLELGFCDMGEVVAGRWSLEEEHLFQEVVFSNPASLGKNFWDHLSMVFPNRTKKDIVSYYFNVFVLRRRAEQNICYPMNIDSDDDEWQGSEDSVEEDEDSVVESPVCQDDPFHNEIHEEDSNEYDDNVANAGFNNCENIVVDCDDSIINVPETQRGKLFWDDSRDHYLQDDSCTSSDAGTEPQSTHVKANHGNYCLDGFNSHEFDLEPCDTKVWDIGYLTCPKNEVDFLPTCSMIEEVFGAGAWNYNASDGQG